MSEPGRAVPPCGDAARDVVLLAHGSPDDRHRGGVERLADAVRTRAAGRRVHTAYLDHHPPAPVDVARVTETGVVVPVLLTPSHHARVDVPAAAAAMRAERGGRFVVALPLGPHPLLLGAAAELLRFAGVAPEASTAVVLFVAGSSDGGAVSSVTGLLESTGPPPGWGPWTVAALDGGPSLADSVRASRADADRVVSVSFTVAEGVLRDRMARRCAQERVELVSGAFDRTGSLADLVLGRVQEAVGGFGQTG